MNNIIISSDFLSTSYNEQTSNTKWCYDLLKRPITQSILDTSLSIKEFYSLDDLNNEDEYLDSKFSRYKFFKLSNIIIDTHEKHIDFNYQNITFESIEYLKKFIDKNCLVIGYELSNNTKLLLENIGIIYIDFWLHPIRFFEDILFGFHSNSTSIQEQLYKFDINKNLFYYYADNYKISFYKGFDRSKELNLIDNSILFIGQTLSDKAICKDGKMLNILDFKEYMRSLLNQYNHIYYAKHPYEKNDGFILDFIENEPNISLINEVSYRLLGNDKIKKVISISSSVLEEAKYFDKEVEFLYKPVININNKNEEFYYNTIFQDFINPTFWSKILTDKFKTNKEVDNIEFIYKKDKLRDMLNFYWSYKNIDKQEIVRNKVSLLENRKNIPFNNNIKTPIERAFKYIPTMYAREEEYLQKIYYCIDTHDYISFDIFDTLLVRPLNEPNDLFDYMNDKVIALTNNKIRNFREARLEAKKYCDFSNTEEIILEARYNAIQEKYNLTDIEKEAIYNLELEIEEKILYKRKFVNDILSYAKNNGKKIVIISDIFFNREFIEKILKKHDIYYDFLFLSSETKVLKHSGNMYKYVLNKLNISANKLFHIGDNEVADIKMSADNGISNYLIPRTLIEFEEKTGLKKTFEELGTSQTFIKGLIANKFLDNPFKYSFPSHCNGNRNLLGYGIIGPMFLAFSHWIINEATKNKYDKIFFLARDGYIIKQCYDLISQFVPNLPKSEYLYASRRALSVPSISSIEDIENIMNNNFSPIELNKLIFNRFGIEISRFNPETLVEVGLEIDKIVSFKKDLKAIISLLSLNKEIIFSHATTEKNIYLSYLDSIGFDGKHNLIVDIGHNGTLQKYLSKITNSKNILGLYFLTHLGIKDNIYNNNMKAKGFVGEEISGRDKNYPYNKYILMFESIFLNKEGSLLNIHFNENEKTFIFNKLDTSLEAERIKFIDEIHTGVLEFIQDFSDLNSKLGLKIDINGRKSINPYLVLLKEPFELDMLMYNNVSFENNYSGREQNYLVKYNPNNLEESLKNSLWTDCFKHCYFSEIEDKQKIRKYIQQAVLFLNKSKIISDKKIQKFNKTPDKFFEDNKFLKFLSKYFKEN